LDDDGGRNAQKNSSDSDPPRTGRSRRRFSDHRLSPEAAERQGRVARLAWTLLGGRDEAIAFLNHHHAALGARPIDLAVASETGCAAVERAIAARAAPR